MASTTEHTVRLGEASLRLIEAEAEAAKARDDRDDAIREARAAGMTLRAIGELAGVSHAYVMRVSRGRYGDDLRDRAGGY